MGNGEWQEGPNFRPTKMGTVPFGSATIIPSPVWKHGPIKFSKAAMLLKSFFNER